MVVGAEGENSNLRSLLAEFGSRDGGIRGGTIVSSPVLPQLRRHSCKFVATRKLAKEEQTAVGTKAPAPGSFEDNQREGTTREATARQTHLRGLHIVRSVLEDHLSSLSREDHASLGDATPRWVRVSLALPAEIVPDVRRVHHVEPEAANARARPNVVSRMIPRRCCSPLIPKSPCNPPEQSWPGGER